MPRTFLAIDRVSKLVHAASPDAGTGPDGAAAKALPPPPRASGR